MFEEQRIIFTCSQPKLINNKKSNEMKKYRNEIDLFGKVKPAVRIQTVRDPRTVLRVDKGLISWPRIIHGGLSVTYARVPFWSRKVFERLHSHVMNLLRKSDWATLLEIYDHVSISDFGPFLYQIGPKSNFRSKSITWERSRPNTFLDQKRYHFVPGERTDLSVPPWLDV